MKIVNSKVKHLKLERKDWLERVNKGEDLLKPPEGYDSVFLEVYDNDRDRKRFTMGLRENSYAEATLDDIQNNLKKTLDFILENEEVDIVDEKGNYLFTAKRYY